MEEGQGEHEEEKGIKGMMKMINSKKEQGDSFLPHTSYLPQNPDGLEDITAD